MLWMIKQRIVLVESRTVGDDGSSTPQLVRYQKGNHLGSVSLEPPPPRRSFLTRSIRLMGPLRIT